MTHRILLTALCAVAITTAKAFAQGGAEWPAYGGDAGGSRWSPLSEITRENVGRLRRAWTYHTGELPPTDRRVSFEATPIVVDGGLFFSTPRGKVIALDPETGAERWKFDARVDSAIRFGDHTSRGVSYWRDSLAEKGTPCASRIFFASIDARLFALDAATGTPCSGFGTGGAVDLKLGLRNPPQRPSEYEETSPPAIINGLVVVGAAVADNGRVDMASGEVRAFDARTGAHRWTWDPVPQDAADPGFATWIGANAHRSGAANTWSVIAADLARDLVFVPTSSASPDYYGGERKRENRYANSLVALRAKTGKLVWHFQTVHHDLWDYDNASPPALVTVHKDGRAMDAVIQGNKSGMLFVLDRDTGAPIFPIEERAVSKSDVTGEEAWPTQPFTTFLPPLVPHTVSPDDAFGYFGIGKGYCRNQIATLRHEGIYTPPSIGGTLVVPSNIGGAHWGGVAFDPREEIAVVPVNRLATLIRLYPREQYSDSMAERVGGEWASMRGTPYVLNRKILTSKIDIPCTKPPWGELVGVSFRTGKIVWRRPLGTTRDLVWAKAHIPFSHIAGTPNLGGPIATAGGVTFIGASFDYKFRAFDTRSGAELWSGKLPAAGKATPMTYKLPGGRQYVVIAAGGDGQDWGRSDALVAFALPLR